VASSTAPLPHFDEGRPWHAHYPDAVPPSIDTAALGTLADIFHDGVARFADRPALESFGKEMSYAELGRAAECIAAWLQGLGLKKGDRVAIMMPNVMAYPPVLFGILTGGFTVVNVNPLYTARELAHQLNDSGAKVLFALENFGHTVEAAAPSLKTLETVVVVAPGDLLGLKGHLINFVSRKVKKAVKPYSLPKAVPFARVMKEGAGRSRAPVDIGLDDIAFLQYTGGTTGVAKGATLLHRNVAANVAQCEAWLRPYAGERADHVMVTALPLYHILALTACGLFMIRLGAKQILVANPRDIEGFVKTLKSKRFTMTVLVNTLYNALANHKGIEEVDFSNLAFCVSGGMATQAAVAKKWKALTGKPIVEGYGLSETSPVVCVNRLDIEEFTGTIGLPVPSTDVQVLSPEGEILPYGQTGELAVRGPQVMAGYWNRPDETAKVMTPDGFFRTGDIAVLQPDGQVKIVDRIKDMILVSGFNVYPNEVEDVLASHPKILEAAVIGVPDSHSGEVPAAYIVKRDESLTAEEVRAFCRENLTGYKVPRHIHFRDALPKTNVGKMLRRALRDEVLGKGET
jgi:long-chain acyl-CoA synthetase